MADTYDAFISYSHDHDGSVAPAVRVGLERLARHWMRRKALRVFHDATGLAATPALWNTLVRTLDSSRYLVLLASPDAASSPWVNREVEHFAARSPGTILLAITDGECEWDETKRDWDWDRTTAVPSSLQGTFADEPLWVDLRWARTEEHLDLRQPQFRAAIGTLAAPIHGVSPDDLDAVDLREYQKAKRARRVAVTGLAALTVTAGAAAFVAVDRSREANEQRDQAIAATDQALASSREADAKRLALLSDTVRADRTDVALLLALHSLRRSPSSEGTLALGSALFQPAGAYGLVPGSEGDGLAIAMAQDAGLLAWSTDDDGVELYDLTQDDIVGELASLAPDDDRTFALRDLSMTHDGSAITATVNDDEVWAAALDQDEPAFEVIARNVVEAAFATRDDRLALAGASGVVTVQDGVDGPSVWERRVLEEPATTVTWSDDDTRLAIASASEIVVVNARTGSDVARWAVPPDSASDIAFDHAGTRIATGGVDGAVRVWRIEDQAQTATFLGHSSQVFRVAWGLDDETLYSSSLDTSIRIWDVGSGRSAGDLRGDVWGVAGLVVGEDGHTLYSSAISTGVRRWELDIGRPRSVLYGHPDAVLSTAFSADGSTIATASIRRTFVWDTDPAVLEPRVDLDDALAYDVDLDPAGRNLAVASGQGTLTVYDAEDGEIVSTPIDDSVALWSVAYSDDGSSLVVGDDEGGVTVLDAASGDVEWQADTGSAGFVGDVAFTPEGDLVVAATSDGLVRWYDGRSGDERGRWEGDEARTQIAPHPDGDSIAIGTSAGEVIVVDLGSGDEQLRFVAHQNQVYELAYSPDGLILATTAFNGGLVGADGFDGGLRLWDAATGARLANLVYHDSQVQDVAWSADGSWFASAGSDGEALQWAGEAQWEDLACTLVGRELDDAERARYLADDDQDTQVCDDG